MDEFKKGERPPAKSLNDIVRKVKRLANINGDGVEASVSDLGITLSVKQPDKIYAKITSGSNPYAWTQVVPDTGGAWVTPTSALAGTTSTNPAYEVNGVSVPANKVVELEHGYGQEWLFQFRKQHGSSSPPCTSNPIKVCPQYEGCSGDDLSGATFTLYKSDGVTILGSTTSNSSGVGTPCISVTSTFSNAILRLTGYPCIYNAPADITGISAGLCGVTINEDFGTLTYNKPDHNCCCTHRCSSLPTTLNATVNGHTVTLTRGEAGTSAPNAFAWYGCFNVTNATVAMYGPGCTPRTTGIGTTPVHVYFGTDDFGSGCNTMGVVFPCDSTSGGGTTAAATKGSCPWDFYVNGSPDPCSPGQPGGGGIIFTLSCDPIYGSGSSVVGIAPNGGTYPNGDTFYQVFGTDTLTMTVSE